MTNSGYNMMLRTMLSLFLILGVTRLQAQPEKKVVGDTTEITVGKKVIKIIDDGSGKKDVHIVESDGDDEEREIEIEREIREEREARGPRWEMGEDRDDDDDDDGDDDDKDKKKRKSVTVSFLNIDLGANFLTHDRNFNLPAESDMLDIKPLNSTNVGLHFFTTRFHMARRHVNLITGITMDNNRFAFRDDITLVPGQDSLTIFNDTLNFRKNKLIVWHGQIPLLLNFQTNPRKKSRNFQFSIGGYAGLLLSANTKQKTNDGDKIKRTDDYNLERFRYGAMARVGYRGIQFYAKYDLSSMFAQGQGPELHPFTFGISLTGPM